MACLPASIEHPGARSLHRSALLSAADAEPGRTELKPGCHQDALIPQLLCLGPSSADVDPQYKADADSSVLRGWAVKGPQRLAEEIGQKLAVGRLLAGEQGMEHSPPHAWMFGPGFSRAASLRVSYRPPTPVSLHPRSAEPTTQRVA